MSASVDERRLWRRVVERSPPARRRTSSRRAEISRRARRTVDERSFAPRGVDRRVRGGRVSRRRRLEACHFQRRPPPSTFGPWAGVSRAPRAVAERWSLRRTHAPRRRDSRELPSPPGFERPRLPALLMHDRRPTHAPPRRPSSRSPVLGRTASARARGASPSTTPAFGTVHTPATLPDVRRAGAIQSRGNVVPRPSPRYTRGERAGPRRRAPHRLATRRPPRSRGRRRRRRQPCTFRPRVDREVRGRARTQGRHIPRRIP